MSLLTELTPYEGQRTTRTRVGRGENSGRGKTCGRGHKGQKSRSGGQTQLGFEGGQMPLFRRLPKKGFTPPNRQRTLLLSLTNLDSFDTETVTTEWLREQGLMAKADQAVKVVANGEIKKAINLKGIKVSKTALAEIEKAGGKLIVEEA